MSTANISSIRLDKFQDHFLELLDISKQEIIKNFQAVTVTNHFNPSAASLTGFNTQASVTKNVTSESRESP